MVIHAMRGISLPPAGYALDGYPETRSDLNQKSGEDLALLTEFKSLFFAI
jgi:hypothetical protein